MKSLWYKSVEYKNQQKIVKLYYGDQYKYFNIPKNWDKKNIKIFHNDSITYDMITVQGQDEFKDSYEYDNIARLLNNSEKTFILLYNKLDFYEKHSFIDLLYAENLNIRCSFVSLLNIISQIEKRNYTKMDLFKKYNHVIKNLNNEGLILEKIYDEIKKDYGLFDSQMLILSNTLNYDNSKNISISYDMVINPVLNDMYIQAINTGNLYFVAMIECLVEITEDNLIIPKNILSQNPEIKLIKNALLNKMDLDTNISLEHVLDSIQYIDPSVKIDQHNMEELMKLG